VRKLCQIRARHVLSTHLRQEEVLKKGKMTSHPCRWGFEQIKCNISLEEFATVVH